MSEMNAVKCVCELNGFKFKGSNIHVDFAKVRKYIFITIFGEALRFLCFYRLKNA